MFTILKVLDLCYANLVFEKMNLGATDSNNFGLADAATSVMKKVSVPTYSSARSLMSQYRRAMINHLTLMPTIQGFTNLAYSVVLLKIECV